MKREGWDIIAKHLTGEKLLEEEQHYIDQAATNNEIKTMIDESADALRKVDDYYQMKQFDTQTAWDKMSQRINTKRFVFSRRWFQIAAIFVFVLTTSVLAMKLVSENRYSVFETSQADLSRQEIILPDGTSVIVNHGTKLKYPKKFKGKTRNINISGEAFFKVMPDQQMPFLVETGSASIKVLGTSFNVFAYNNSPVVEVVVETGSVELSNNSSKRERLLLLAGEKGSLDKATGAVQKEMTLGANQLSWITHEIRFQHSSLREVVSTLEHVYNVSIELDADVDLSQIITATFNQQEPDYILDVVALTLNLDIINSGTNSFHVKNR